MLLRNFFGVCLGAVLLCHGGAGQSRLACPAVRTTSGWLDLFPLPCTKSSECGVMGARHLCCKGFCTKAVQTNDAAVQPKPPALLTSVAPSTSTATAPPAPTTTTTVAPTPTTTAATTTSRAPTAAAPATVAAPAAPEPPPQPFFQVLPIQTSKPKAKPKATAAAVSEKAPKLTCPKSKSTPVVLFPIPCENTAQCRKTSGPEQVCCGGRCVAGVRAPKIVAPPPTHQPLLGIIPRECPSEPLGELLFEVQTCKADSDCWPRVCCPDGKRSYCRTARARLDLVPGASQINAPVRAVERYLQCTAPPTYDLFPRACSSSLDCFPNLCCAEGGKKHCRPPQRSLLALLAGVGQV